MLAATHPRVMLRVPHAPRTALVRATRAWLRAPTSAPTSTAASTRRFTICSAASEPSSTQSDKAPSGGQGLTLVPISAQYELTLPLSAQL
jgi:hypothetical protein